MKKSLCQLFVLLVLSSCLKQKNELPDTTPGSDPHLSVNYSLRKLNELLPVEGSPMALDSDLIIYAVVRANDASGNFYKQLFIEDSTAGISLLLDEENLNSRFPVNQKIYLRLKGLYLGNAHGTLQLGAMPVADNSGKMQVSSIQARDFSRYITMTGVSVAMKPVTVQLSELSSIRHDLINRLIMVDEVELDNPDQDRQYAKPTATTNIGLHDCKGATAILRTSSYANFHSSATPYGKGSMTAIYTVYDGVGQLMIRDTNDVAMGPVRCDGSIREEPVIVSIDALHNMYSGKDTVLGNLSITAVVTSDAASKNFGTGNIIVQDSKRGVMVYFGSQAVGMPDFGDSVFISLSGTVLTRYNGILEIKNIKTAQARVYGKAKAVLPVQVTIAELNARFEKLESMLVKIVNAKITTGGNYSGSKTLQDATGSIILYTSSTAAFANHPVPAITKTVQGIVTPYNTTKELKLRNPAIDVY